MKISSTNTNSEFRVPANIKDGVFVIIANCIANRSPPYMCQDSLFMQ